jgi:hypothetical protein
MHADRPGEFGSRTAARVDHREEVPVDWPDELRTETFNPWSVVNLVFSHLAEQGLHPILGSAGDPSVPAAQLLRSLGIVATSRGNRQVSDEVADQLAEIRARVFDGN